MRISLPTLLKEYNPNSYEILWNRWNNGNHTKCQYVDIPLVLPKLGNRAASTK